MIAVVLPLPSNWVGFAIFVRIRCGRLLKDIFPAQLLGFGIARTCFCEWSIRGIMRTRWALGHGRRQARVWEQGRIGREPFAVEKERQ